VIVPFGQQMFLRNEFAEVGLVQAAAPCSLGSKPHPTTGLLSTAKAIPFQTTEEAMTNARIAGL